MPRYEFSEGTSNKFWEITLEGSSFTTRYGKIGTDGQVTLKEFDSADKAQKEYDKLVAEKTKKGYVEQ
ncbi:MAG: WGR domain-containing protein [Polyangiaceae bacterium]